MTSPYAGVPVANWPEVTRELVAQHPLSLELIHDAAMLSWDRLWNTWVGEAKIGFPLADIDPPATVIGYMFEKLFAKELAERLPGAWRGGEGSEKDLHCLENDAMSVEMKASGQLGYKIFGNRSYGQVLANAGAAKKDKSGYYITVNFFGQRLTLLRFGWIDATDWQAQASATGQMAGLSAEVYDHKLVPIVGPYMLNGPVQLLGGVGAKAAGELSAVGVHSIAELVGSDQLPAKYEPLRTAARERYKGLL
jgi:ScaI restriction endonuclease